MASGINPSPAGTEEKLTNKSYKSPAIVISDEDEGYRLESFCLSHSPLDDLESVLIPGGLVQDRIERLACDIATDLANEPYTALCILKGGYLFFNDLLDKVKMLFRLQSAANPNLMATQQIRIEFIRLKSYEDDSSTGQLRVIGMESLESLRGKNVLIVEDIIDTGNTMVKFLKILSSYQVKSLRVASLFVKRTSRNTSGYRPDYYGFEVPDKFIVGCNLDYNEYFRELSHVCVISNKGKERYSVKK